MTRSPGIAFWRSPRAQSPKQEPEDPNPMSKNLRLVLALGIASLAGLSLTSAEEKKPETVIPKCCAAAAAKGEECKHECCIKAKAAGEVCKECPPAKKEEAPKAP